MTAVTAVTAATAVTTGLTEAAVASSSVSSDRVPEALDANRAATGCTLEAVAMPDRCCGRLRCTVDAVTFRTTARH